MVKGRGDGGHYRRCPLDLLGGALDSIKKEYEAELGRRPTKKEWEAMLCATLGNRMPEFKYVDEGVVSNVILEVRHDSA